MANCPECGTRLDIENDEVDEGETLTCPECDAELEVVNSHPLELVLARLEDKNEFGKDEERNENYLEDKGEDGFS